MKKTFLSRRNALLSSQTLSWGVFALLFALLALLLRLIAPALFWHVVTPVFRVSEAVATESHAFFSSFGDAQALAALNEKLTSENAALANENQALVQKVVALSGLSAQKEISGILAGVVARPPVSPYDTLVLAAGKKAGVALGMEAFGENGSPIGTVSAVLDDFSWVTLFSAPGMMTSGWVGHTSVPLTLLGSGAGTLGASISRSANIVVGDTVFVPGPGELPIGSVVRVDSDPLSPGVTLRISPVTNPFSLSWVTLRATGIVPSSFATSTLP